MGLHGAFWNAQLYGGFPKCHFFLIYEVKHFLFLLGQPINKLPEQLGPFGLFHHYFGTARRGIDHPIWIWRTFILIVEFVRQCFEGFLSPSPHRAQVIESEIRRDAEKSTLEFSLTIPLFSAHPDSQKHLLNQILNGTFNPHDAKDMLADRRTVPCKKRFKGIGIALHNLANEGLVRLFYHKRLSL